MRTNHKGGWALIQASLLSWMQHRGFFWLLAFGWMLPLVIYLFVWSAAAGEGSVGGFTQNDFTLYYLFLIVVNQITYSQTNWTVGDSIRYGGVNQWLLRPIPNIYNTLSAEGAGKIVYMTFALPVAVLLAVLLRSRFDLGLLDGVLFIPALLMAWGVRFFWGYWLASLAFWASNANSLLSLQDTLVFLLGGQVAPIALLPAQLQTVARFLPFRYMLGFPVEVLTGRLSQDEMIFGFAVQFIWLAVSIFLQQIIWHRGLRKYAAVGG